MSLNPPRPHARLWRWAVATGLLLVLLAGYWAALQHLGNPRGEEAGPAAPRQSLDRHMPRVY